MRVGVFSAVVGEEQLQRLELQCEVTRCLGCVHPHYTFDSLDLGFAQSEIQGVLRQEGGSVNSG